MPQSVSIEFKTERFDYLAQLPEEYNAGNRFYGKDVAEFLAEQLTNQGLRANFIDEDWGWLVFGEKSASPVFDVTIYNLAEHSEGNRPGVPEWGLWVRAYELSKRFGILPKRSLVSVPSTIRSAIHAAVRAAGAEPMHWDDGPDGP